MTRQKKSSKLAIIVFIILLIIDQVSKIIVIGNNINFTIIPNVLEIQTIKNTGGAFGVGQGNIVMFIITNFVVLGLIIRFIYLQKDFMDEKTLYTLIIILAGGIGNLIDRLTRGFVIDFINIFPSINFPRFNFADIYITGGWITLALIFAIYSYKEVIKNKKKKE